MVNEVNRERQRPPERDGETLDHYEDRLRDWAFDTQRGSYERFRRLACAAFAQSWYESSSSDAVQVLQGWFVIIEDEADTLANESDKRS